jgi:hypothetical protein
MNARPTRRPFFATGARRCPNDRLAQLVKDATPALVRALQVRLAEHKVSFGHWCVYRKLHPAPILAFAHKDSLFLRPNSLFDQNNSLFR